MIGKKKDAGMLAGQNDLYDDDLITEEDLRYYDPENLSEGAEGMPPEDGYDDDGDPEIDREIDSAMARRARRRKKDRRVRNFFIALIIAIIAIAACLAYAFILIPQDGDLPWPSFLGERPSQVPQALSFLERDPGENPGAVTIVTSEKETAAEEQAVSEKAEDAQPETAGQPETHKTQAETEAPVQPQTAASDAHADTMAQADLLAAQYDYDGAIALLQGIPGYQSDQTITDAIAQYQSEKDSCVAVDVTTVPHIFYHSLVNEPSLAFNPDVMGQGQADGFNAWMVTTDEFDQVTQRLYDAGYVYVRLRDLVVETKDADGTPHFTPNPNLMLPEGKKAIVLSVDDLSYYHSYEPAGYPDKLVLDDQGNVKCHMDASGNESLGDYDVVPRLNTFLAEHPDGCYKGARGLIALTGYNGVFGYRTDTDYVKKEHLMEDQAAWLDAHPDFSFDQEVAEAKKIADALKSEGWEFASHTWGHLSVTDKTADELKADNEKWVATVQPIVGPTDTIIFAHGNDIGDWEGYKEDNDKYNYYNSVGYHFYCNVDGSVPNWVQITDRYVRQGRIDVDGYRLWLCKNGEDTSLSQLIDTTGIFSDQRPTPVVANGQS